MKMTMSKINRMSVAELQRAIDKAENAQTVYTTASKAELVNKYIALYNKGLIK